MHLHVAISVWSKIFMYQENLSDILLCFFCLKYVKYTWQKAIRRLIKVASLSLPKKKFLDLSDSEWLVRRRRSIFRRRHFKQRAVESGNCPQECMETDIWCVKTLIFQCNCNLQTLRSHDSWILGEDQNSRTSEFRFCDTLPGAPGLHVFFVGILKNVFMSKTSSWHCNIGTSVACSWRNNQVTMMINRQTIWISMKFLPISIKNQPPNKTLDTLFPQKHMFKNKHALFGWVPDQIFSKNMDLGLNLWPKCWWPWAVAFLLRWRGGAPEAKELLDDRSSWHDTSRRWYSPSPRRCRVELSEKSWKKCSGERVIFSEFSVRAQDGVDRKPWVYHIYIYISCIMLY